MTLFDLLFLASVLATLASLAAAAVFAFAGRRPTSLRVLRGLAVYVAVYLVASLAVSLAMPQRVLSVGDPWCFDDWCLTVEHVARSSEGEGQAYRVDMRLSSRARRVSQRAMGAWAYLVDERGRRFAPESRAGDVPLDTRLEPGASVRTSRTFSIPAGVTPVGFVTGHGGPYCGAMSMLIIGSSGCLFHKPTMVRLP